MKKSIMLMLKYCKPIYVIYYYVGTGILNFIKMFIKTDERLILFNSFGGKRFDDSPKAIYDEMSADPEFAEYRLVWAFQEPEKYHLSKGEKIKSDTLAYFIMALKARCWITNSSLERGLGFTGKKTFFVNTWHGTPIKKMGTDIAQENSSFRSKNSWNMDVMTAQSQYEADIFTRVFQLRPGVCRVSGLPRNDKLANADADMQKSYREKLGISDGKKIILYAPTFREYQTDESLKCKFQTPPDWEVWTKKLGSSYFILLRTHYEAVQSMQVDNYPEFIKDVSDYPSLNELMIASDLLISDYSSIFFDYSILERPMFCFAYDYEQYESFRGLYFDIREWLLGGSVNQDELLQLILGLEQPERYESAVIMTRKFRDAFVECYGKGTDNVLKMIKNELK